MQDAIKQQFADGGMAEEDDPVGGIMDLESGRQMYFLGKLVKKAGRAIKKVVKSPIGKIALLAGGAGLFGFGPAKGLFASGKGLAFKNFLMGQKAIPRIPDTIGRGDTKGLLGNVLGFAKDNSGLVIGGLSTLPLMFQKQQDQFDIDDEGIDIAKIRSNPYEYLAPRFMAEGGKAEPVAKKTMPLLDMDGKEKDYRETGGFVDMGRMERADDVPARLSKNEFVFTADAVRNAGEGDIDKGAEVMYNMMKNLEAGGEVSEESQGLDGARKMFKTSQRLEEVL
jgi:hypothetical protein